MSDSMTLYNVLLLYTNEKKSKYKNWCNMKWNIKKCVELS